MTVNADFGYPCEYCDGTVRPKKVEREAFKQKNGFVILEDVTIGVCDACGNRYYSAETLRAAQDIAKGSKSPKRTDAVRVG